MYGWKRADLGACYLRCGAMNASPILVRQWNALNITGGLRGCGRMGADCWLVIRNKKGDYAEINHYFYARGWRPTVTKSSMLFTITYILDYINPW